MILTLFSEVFGLPSDVVAATLGDVGIQEVVGLTTGLSPTPTVYACSSPSLSMSHSSLSFLTILVIGIDSRL